MDGSIAENKNVLAAEHFGDSQKQEQIAKDFIWNHMKVSGREFYIALSKRQDEGKFIDEVSCYISYKKQATLKSRAIRLH